MPETRSFPIMYLSSSSRITSCDTNFLVIQNQLSFNQQISRHNHKKQTISRYSKERKYRKIVHLEISDPGQDTTIIIMNKKQQQLHYLQNMDKFGQQKHLI